MSEATVLKSNIPGQAGKLQEKEGMGGAPREPPCWAAAAPAHPGPAPAPASPAVAGYGAHVQVLVRVRVDPCAQPLMPVLVHGVADVHDVIAL